MCVPGLEPRTISSTERDALTDLAAMVMAQIELPHTLGRVGPLSGMPNRKQFIEDYADLHMDRPHGEPRVAVLVNMANQEQLNNAARVMGASYFDDLMNEAIGIASFLLGRTDCLDVLRIAQNAMQDAHQTGQLSGSYSPAQDDAYRRRFTLLNAFDAALADTSQLRLVYQPRIDLTSGRCIGAEALLRWRHPELGDVSPGECMPVVEQTSMVRDGAAEPAPHGAGLACAWRSTTPAPATAACRICRACRRTWSRSTRVLCATWPAASATAP